MKKNIIITLIAVNVFLAICFTFVYIFKDKKVIINEDDWYVEVTNEYINVRSEASAYSSKIGTVYEGAKFKVLDINLDDEYYYWYYIQVDYYNEGWIASGRETSYLTDFNNPHDIKSPTLKFYDEIYYTYSIETITYDHLEITDDKNDYIVSHEVFKSEDNLYWITYTVTDAAGHSISKTQQTVFEEKKD